LGSLYTLQLALRSSGAGQNRETGTQFCHLYSNPLNPASRIDVQEGRERGAGQADREKVRKITFSCAAKHRKMFNESAIV
jgi:hypothetical protein